MSARFTEPFRLVVLCMDGASRRFLERIDLDSVIVISPNDLGDPELIEVGAERPAREFCWTCKPSLIRYCMSRIGDDEIVAYLDADLLFFADFKLLYREITGRSILIHEHRYAMDRKYMLKSSGRFNAGFIAVRNNREGISCVERWRSQCIDRCELNPAEGLCGDQKYLDEWPKLYNGLAVLKHEGGGVAPWNVERSVVSEDGNKTKIDGKDVVFFHYHALRVIRHRFIGRTIVRPAVGYSFSVNQLRYLYLPYAAMLREAVDLLSGHGWTFENEEDISFRKLVRRLFEGTYLISPLPGRKGI